MCIHRGTGVGRVSGVAGLKIIFFLSTYKSMDFEKCGNRVAVRRYYERNRASIIKSKALVGCRKQGRVPRVSTIQRYEISIETIINEFRAWQQTLPPDNLLRVERSTRMNAVLQQCARV